VAKQMEALRGFGKVCILGMGYGMGPDRFSDYASCNAQTAERAVYFYRDKYPAIPQLWRDLDDALWYGGIKGQHLAVEAGWNGPASRLIRLPSGRTIRYPELCGEKGDLSVKWSEKERLAVWGGVFTENICQAIARDVLTEAIDRIEKRGVHVCHHIYDQILIHTDDANVPNAITIAVEELTRRPVWGLDLPLAAKAKVRDHYVAD
jgi:DNA polymerase bacteriophage-type